MESPKPIFWQTSHSPWLGTEFLLRRNLDKYPFPEKMSSEQRGRSSILLEETLVGLPSLQNPIYRDIATLSAQEKELWQETFFSSLHDAQGLLTDDSRSFSALIHGEDHLQLYLLTDQPPLPDPWNRLAEIENSIAQFLSFAFDPRFGYLTANPQSAGTALTIRAFLHLPTLIQGKPLEELLEALPEDVIAYGLGENREFLADLIVMENRYKLGLNEETIIHILTQNASSLVLKEQTAREQLKENPSTELLDKVARSHALFTYSHQLKREETLMALSLVQLGSSLGWIENLPPHFFSTLFFDLQHGHLATFQNPEESAESARSRLIHSLYAPAKLKVAS